MAVLSGIGLIPIGGDLAKATSKIAEFIGKNIDKTDELAELCTTLLKEFPDDVAKILPASVIDDIIVAIENGELKLTHKMYEQLSEIVA